MSDGKDFVCKIQDFVLQPQQKVCGGVWGGLQGELMYRCWEFKWSHVRAAR